VLTLRQSVKSIAVDKVLSLLALLVQKYQYCRRRRCRRCMRVSGSKFLSFFFSFTGTKVPILTQKALQALYAHEWLKILDDLNTAPAIRDLEVVLVLVLKYLLYWDQSTCFISES
jgi:hypothetical protein